MGWRSEARPTWAFFLEDETILGRGNGRALDEAGWEDCLRLHVGGRLGRRHGTDLSIHPGHPDQLRLPRVRRHGLRGQTQDTALRGRGGEGTSREDDQVACRLLGQRLAEWTAVFVHGRHDQHPANKDIPRLSRRARSTIEIRGSDGLLVHTHFTQSSCPPQFLQLPTFLTMKTPLIAIFGLLLTTAATPADKTTVSIVGDAFHLNGSPTYPGREWRGHKVEGRLMNSRMVQGIFDDRNSATVKRWAYPNTGKWDASATPTNSSRPCPWKKRAFFPHP